jgi:hypothetical protein
MDDKAALLNFLGTFYGQANKLDQDTVVRSSTASNVSGEYKKLFEQVARSPQQPELISPLSNDNVPQNADTASKQPYQPIPEEIIQQMIPEVEKTAHVPQLQEAKPINNIDQSTESKIVIALNDINNTLKNIEKLLELKLNVRQRKTKNT